MAVQSYFGGGAGVNTSRLCAGSGLGFGLGAFLTSFLPLSLLPMAASVPQSRASLQGRDGINFALEFRPHELVINHGQARARTPALRTAKPASKSILFLGLFSYRPALRLPLRFITLAWRRLWVRVRVFPHSVRCLGIFPQDDETISPGLAL